MVTKKEWKDFQDTGLLLFINQFLHIFGWAIVIETKDDGSVSAWPARVKYRGFDNTNTEKAYIQISEYMNKTASELLNEVNDG